MFSPFVHTIVVSNELRKKKKGRKQRKLIGAPCTSYNKETICGLSDGWFGLNNGCKWHRRGSPKGSSAEQGLHRKSRSVPLLNLLTGTIATEVNKR